MLQARIETQLTLHQLNILLQNYRHSKRNVREFHTHPSTNTLSATWSAQFVKRAMIFSVCGSRQIFLTKVFSLCKESIRSLSIPVWNVLHVKPHWRVVIQRNSLFWDDNIYIYHHHHYHIALVARISLTLSRHSSLSFIALGRSSGQHPVSSHSCWMYVRAGRPAFARPCVGIHKSTSLMSSSLLLQQCPACLVRLTWIVFVIGGRWPYSWCLVGCCCQDLFRIARSILV